MRATGEHSKRVPRPAPAPSSPHPLQQRHAQTPDSNVTRITSHMSNTLPNSEETCERKELNECARDQETRRHASGDMREEGDQGRRGRQTSQQDRHTQHVSTDTPHTHTTLPPPHPHINRLIMT